MLSLVILLFITSLSINLFFIINPLSLGISILLIALLISILFSYSISSWIAFLIFLIYVRGILVIFAYFISLTPNLTINMPSVIRFITVSILLLITISYTLHINILTNTSHLSCHNTLYLRLNSPSLIIIAIILLLTIIIVIKITTYSKGPLRPFK